MIEPRLYRAAFVPAVLALLVAMFSLESRPPSVPQGLPADALFDGRAALATAQGLVRAHPDRRPGSRGDLATAGAVERELAADGFATSVDRFGDDDRPLANVVGRRPGTSPRQVVVVAARDGAGVPDATASGADTAALLEMAQVFRGRVARKTLVLASVDGSTLGDVGARRLADRLGDPRLVDAVLVVSNLGAPRARGPLLVPWSSDSGRENIGLARTASASLRRELGQPPGGESAPGQLVRLAFPLGVGAQGPLLAGGLDALRFSASGELPPTEHGLSDLDADRYGAFGRAVLRTVLAIDADGSPEHGPGTYVLAARQVVPGWAISLLALALVLPAVVAAIDGFARARRRRQPVGRWAGWVLAGAVPFALALLAARVLELLGAADAPPGAFAPAERPLGVAGAMVLAVALAVAALGWVRGRPALLGRIGGVADPTSPGAASATALILSALALAVWALNPFAALFLVPALHLWIVATSAEVRPAPAVLLVLGGLVLPLGAGLVYLERLGLDPLAGLWYAFLLVTGGQVALQTLALGCLLLGVLGSVVTILTARARAERSAPPRPSVRGPGGHVGPGALGAVAPAVRR